MTAPFHATFKYLLKTDNEAALDVLVAALDCPHLASRRAALRVLLQQPNPAGHGEVFRRMDRLEEDIREVVREHPERLVPVVAKGLRASAPEEVAAACDAAISFRLYEAVPKMVASLVKPDYAHATTVAGALLRLTELFYAELTGAEPSQRRDPENVRQQITSSLEDAVRKFHHHGQRQVVEALVLLVKHSNVTLRQLLSRPEESCYEAMRDVLVNSSQGGVIRLLLGLLEDAQSPRAAMVVIGQRCDNKFLEHLLRRIGPRPSKTVAETLARIDAIAWAQPGHPTLGELSDEAQQGAVQMLMASGMPRQKVLDVIGYLLLNGSVAGRREAAKALAQFDQPEATTFLIKAINDDEPEVRAHLLVQLRPRNIRGAMILLVRLADSSDTRVQQALRTALPEFTVRHFLANFDSLADELRITAGAMVKKIDTDAVAELNKELTTRSPVRRRRAVLAAEATGLVQELEQTIVKLLADDDHMVRVAAARVLADCKSRPTWEALRDAMLDRSFVVREAAEQSLLNISSSLASATPEEQESEEVAP